jgi:hypothetical protein
MRSDLGIFLRLLRFIACFTSLICLLTGCSFGSGRQTISATALLTTLRSSTAHLLASRDVPQQFSVVAFRDTTAGFDYPELGCIIGAREGLFQQQQLYLMSTLAHQHTEALVLKPLAILQDRFYDQYVTCIFINDVPIPQALSLIIIDTTGHREQLPVVAHSSHILISRPTTVKHPPFAEYLLLDAKNQVLYRTTTADAGYP